MNIDLAKQTLEQFLNNKTADNNAVQLALDILNNTYKAEFTNLQVAQQEANDATAEVANQKNIVVEKEALIAEHEATIASVNATLDSTKSDLEAKITDLATTQDTLTQKTAELETTKTDLADVQAQLDVIQTKGIQTAEVPLNV